MLKGGNVLVFRGWGADKPGICQARKPLIRVVGPKSDQSRAFSCIFPSETASN